MRKWMAVLLVASLAAFLGPNLSAAETPRAGDFRFSGFTIDYSTATGFGILEDDTRFILSAWDIDLVMGPFQHYSNDGWLSFGGEYSRCVVDSVAEDCSTAWLLCNDVPVEVVSGVPHDGQNRGMLDGLAVTRGIIILRCGYYSSP